MPFSFLESLVVFAGWQASLLVPLSIVAALVGHNPTAATGAFVVVLLLNSLILLSALFFVVSRRGRTAPRSNPHFAVPAAGLAVCFLASLAMWAAGSWKGVA